MPSTIARDPEESGGLLVVSCENYLVSEPASELQTIAPDLVQRLGAVDGVLGIVLGGSRARGDHRSESDYDLGIYYSGDLDVRGLQAIADQYSTTPTAVTQPGGWGPWVDGGGWLKVNGAAIDFIYRDLDRVREVWADCQLGRYRNEIQAGHPLGFWSHSYAGELALAAILSDTDGDLARLQAETSRYPQPLAEALVSASWEASFSLANARKAVGRLDVAYIAGCMFRAVGVLSHSLHGHDRRWLLNEKGAVAATDRLPSAPEGFARRVSSALTTIGPTEHQLTAACAQLEAVTVEALRDLTSASENVTSALGRRWTRCSETLEPPQPIEASYASTGRDPLGIGPTGAPS